MKLLFTGTTAVWFVLLLFAAMCVLTVWVYRRHRLPKPWNWVLPGLRIAAVALLLLTLFQPVLGRVHRSTVRGRIPVIVDNSGSMSIVDRFQDAEQVEIGWNLGMFGRSVRMTAFAEAAQAANATSQQFNTLQAAVEGVSQGNANSNAATSLARHRQRLTDVTEAAKRLAATTTQAIRKTDYLGSPDAAKAQVAAPPGKLLYERFEGISGSTVADLLNSKRFPLDASRRSTLDRFAAPTNVGDDFGARIRGFLRPPTSGRYVFSITSDDEGQLFLSDGLDPSRKRLVAHVPDWAAFDEYGRYPSQQSDGIRLDANGLYYVEALHKEGTGDDHLSVGWRRPDGVLERPIPGKYFAGFGGRARAAAFAARYRQFSGVLAKLDGELNAAAELWDKADAGGAGELRRLGEQISHARESWQTATSMLTPLQQAADEALASAGVPDVDTALAAIAGMSRWDWVHKVLESEPQSLLAALRQRGEVEMFAQGEPVRAVANDELGMVRPAAPSTRLGSVLHGVLRQYEQDPVAAVVLLTDGNNNAGKSLPEMRNVLAERGIPLIAIGVGCPQPPPDVVIERVLAPQSSFQDDALNLRVILRRYGFENRAVQLTVSRDGDVVREETVPPGDESVVAVDLSFTESEAGRHYYRVDAEQLPGEVLTGNNTKGASVSILTDPIRVLLVDEFPRWETRYANMMLSRDKRVELKTIFAGCLENADLASGPAEFPTTEEAFLAYDVVILGDLNPQHLSAEQLAAIRTFVTDRGGTLILMAGTNYMPNAYQATVLGDVLPCTVMFSEGRATVNERGSVEIPLSLRQGAEYDELAQIGLTPEMTRTLWRELPGMTWVKSGLAPTAAAEFLVETDPLNWPVMLHAPAGLGKILYLGSDAFWRWRYRAKWRFHHRFWGQILLWAIRGRTSGVDRYVKLMAERSAYSPGETVTLKARAFGRDNRPLTDAILSAEIYDASGKVVRNVKFLYLAKSGGEYRAQVKDLPRGTYRVVPRVVELADVEVKAECRFEVRDLPTSEYVDLALDHTGLARLADVYRPFFRADEVVKDVPKIALVEEHREDHEVWDSYYLLIIVAILLGAEWQLRKQNRLV